MRRNLIITGGSGFIGSYIIEYLVCKYNIIVIGRKNFTSIKTANGTLCPYYYCDYSRNSIIELFRIIKPICILHLAAKRPDGNNSISDYYENLKISGNLFESCLEYGVKNIVNISTRLVYSTDTPLPWQEDSVIQPTSYYGLSKQWVENTATYYNEKGLKIKTLRLGQVIGIGEREGYALQVYLNSAIKGQPINVFGEAKGKRHYIYAKDVASAIESAFEFPNEMGIYNIGMSSIYGFDELAQTVNKVFDNKSEIIYNKDTKADENIYYMSIKKAELELLWRPSYSLQEAYEDIKSEIDKNKYHFLNQKSSK